MIDGIFYIKFYLVLKEFLIIISIYLILPLKFKKIIITSLLIYLILTYIEIPSSVIKIGAQTFGWGDKTVLNVKMESPTAPECHEDAFMFRKVNLLIPNGSKDNYIWATGWNKTGTPTEYN